LPLSSIRARRDSGVVRQAFDYSCGSASLATLLTYGLGDAVDEAGLLRSLLRQLAPEELEALTRQGLSLTHLQSLAQQRGHKAQGFRIPQAQLHRLTRPVIVFIRPGGHEHFAVLKGLRGDRAYLADPTLGNVRMPLYRFLDMWADASGRGIVLALEPASGAWPARYALQIRADEGLPIEALSAQNLTGTSVALPSNHPER
jgi:predicted double-glycine peptidase